MDAELCPRKRRGHTRVHGGDACRYFGEITEVPANYGNVKADPGASKIPH